MIASLYVRISPAASGISFPDQVGCDFGSVGSTVNSWSSRVLTGKGVVLALFSSTRISYNVLEQRILVVDAGVLSSFMFLLSFTVRLCPIFTTAPVALRRFDGPTLRLLTGGGVASLAYKRTQLSRHLPLFSFGSWSIPLIHTVYG